MNLEEARTRLTISVPEAGELLEIGRDSAYRAAERGEIPTLRLGRSLRVPVPRLLQLLGVPQTDSETGPHQDPATASTTSPRQEIGHDHGHSATAFPSNVHALGGR